MCERIHGNDTDLSPARLNPIPSHVASRGVHSALLAVNCLFNIPQNPRKRSPAWFTAHSPRPMRPSAPSPSADVRDENRLKILLGPENVRVSDLRRRSFLQEIILMQPHGEFRLVLVFAIFFLSCILSIPERAEAINFKPLTFTIQINSDKWIPKVHHRSPYHHRYFDIIIAAWHNGRLLYGILCKV